MFAEKSWVRTRRGGVFRFGTPNASHVARACPSHAVNKTCDQGALWRSVDWESESVDRAISARLNHELAHDERFMREGTSTERTEQCAKTLVNPLFSAREGRPDPEVPSGGQFRVRLL